MTVARTAKQRAALRKAQLASARKRKGKGKSKLRTARRRAVVVAATGGLALAAAGIAGNYYIRKVAGGGPKAPKLNHSGPMPAGTRRVNLGGGLSARVRTVTIPGGGGPAHLPSRLALGPGHGPTRSQVRRKAANEKRRRARHGTSNPNRLFVVSHGRGGSRPIERSRGLWELNNAMLRARW